jgi:hypothetical protein
LVYIAGDLFKLLNLRRHIAPYIRQYMGVKNDGDIEIASYPFGNLQPLADSVTQNQINVDI